LGRHYDPLVEFLHEHLDTHFRRSNIPPHRRLRFCPPHTSRNLQTPLWPSTTLPFRLALYSFAPHILSTHIVDYSCSLLPPISTTYYSFLFYSSSTILLSTHIRAISVPLLLCHILLFHDFSTPFLLFPFQRSISTHTHRFFDHISTAHTHRFYYYFRPIFYYPTHISHLPCILPRFLILPHTFLPIATTHIFQTIYDLSCTDT